MQIGVDVVAVDRVAALVAGNPRFVQRVFTAGEQRDCAGKPRRWASSWAAKEAVRKLFMSVGGSPPAFRDVEVVRSDETGPRVRVRNAESDIALSLTHDAGIAIAVVAAGPAGLSGAAMISAGLKLPARPDDAHKGTFGRVVVIAGARGYTGAPLLAALGAARAGAGLVTVCVPETIYPIVAAQCLEVMPVAAPDRGAGVLTADALGVLAAHLETADAAVIGPGLGRADDTAAALLRVLADLRCRAVLDADALSLGASWGFEWRTSPQPLVLTPHPAEMARLAGIDTAAVQRDRERVAETFARANGVVVVLKGAGTVIASPDGRMHVDAHRVVALASGGTGDVLAGVIGGLLAQGLDGFDAAVAGVTIHAEAGLLVQAQRGRAGALASDVLDALPTAQERLRRAIKLSVIRRDQG